jgi:transposase InsO family protein
MMAIVSAQEGAQHPTPSPVFPNKQPPPPPNSISVVHLNEQKVFAAFDGTPDPDPTRWILDSGASNHMSGSRAAFAHLDTGIHGSVRFGDGSTAQIEGSGTVLFTCKNGEHQTLSNVYYLPRLTANIVSVGQLDETGYQVLVEHGLMHIRDEERRLLAKVPRSPGRLYVLIVTIARPICLAARTNDEAWTWHDRFGHANFTALRKMARDELVRGMPTIKQVDQLCEACLAGKQRRTPFPQKALRRLTEPLQLLHGDLCGPITPATPSSNRYFLLLVDDYSRYMWIVLLPSKDAAAAAIKNVQAAAERKSGKKLLALRTDRGGEFAAADFTDYCAHLGVRRELTTPYTPQQNGVVERRNQTVVGTARSMMKNKGLPGVFWGEAVTTAVYLLNRTSCKANQGATPYELWTGSTPAVHHLRTFGCVAHVKATTPNPKKLDDRNKRMIFVGYEPGSKAYRAYNPLTRRVHISRDIIFDEAVQWAWTADHDVHPGDFIIEEADLGGLQLSPQLQHLRPRDMLHLLPLRRRHQRPGTWPQHRLHQVLLLP